MERKRQYGMPEIGCNSLDNLSFIHFIDMKYYFINDHFFFLFSIVVLPFVALTHSLACWMMAIIDLLYCVYVRSKRDIFCVFTQCIFSTKRKFFFLLTLSKVKRTKQKKKHFQQKEK